MAVYKEEKTNTWRAVYRYTDWNGERKQTQMKCYNKVVTKVANKIY